MSNYPDGFNLDAYERTLQQPEDVLPDDARSVYSAQAAYRECVRACVVVLRKHGFTCLSKEDVSYLGFASTLEDVLEKYVKQELRNLEQEGFDLTVRDQDHERFFDEQYKFLKSKKVADVKLTQQELAEIHQLHRLWLENKPGGCRADLSRADLRGANLSGFILSDADISGANLAGANLANAGLTGASFRGANLSGANLEAAILLDANLTGANLTGANMRGAVK